jgi:hypothetical protein
MAIRIGTAERGGTFHSQGLALKAVLERIPALAPVDVQETSHASIGNANRLHFGHIHFGMMAANWVARAKSGERPFTQPIALRMVAPMNAGPIFFVARAETAVRAVADLRGRRVATGTENGGMTQHARTILGALGMSWADIEPVYLDFAAGADALAAGEIDAQFQCPIPNKVMTELSRRIAVRVLPYGERQLDAVLGAAPAYRRTIMRRGAIRGLDSDTAQVAVVNVLVTHARLDDARVHALTRAVIAGADELARRNPLFTGLADLFEPLRTDGARALEFGGAPLHPGALAAYREMGLVR